MGRPVSFDFTTGGGSPEEFLMGTVHLEPTLMHTIGSTVVLPDAPYPVKLVNGKAVHPNVAVSPAGPEPAWAYKVTIENELTGKAWSEFRGVPTGTTQIAYKDLTKFVTTIPPQTTAGMMQNWADTAQDGASRAETAAAAAEAPTDLMNKNLIENPTSLTAGALSAAIDDTAHPAVAESKVLTGNADSGSMTVALTGHSLMYGQDTTSGSTLPATNGSSITRSVSPPPEVFAAALAKVAVFATAKTIVNQAYPGDQTTKGSGNAFDRWATGSSGDVEVFWLDTNDAKNYAGFPTGQLTPTESLTGLGKLLTRAKERGAQAVVISGAAVNAPVSVRRVQAFAEGHRRMAERFGAVYVDAAELLRGLPRASGYAWYVSDTTHLKPEAYAIMGARLAALFGPRGANPRKVGPGSIIRPHEFQHAGGNLMADRANGGTMGVLDGGTIKLGPGETVTFPINPAIPVRPIVEFYQGIASSGNGTGRILYANGVAGVGSLRVDTSASPSGMVFASGHVMDTGPDVITITCDTGSLEVASVRFVSAEGSRYAGQRLTGDVATGTAQRMSRLSGVTVAGTNPASYIVATDEHTPASLLKTDGTLASARIDFALDLPHLSAGPAGCGVAASTALEGSTYWMRSGWFIFRGGGADSDKLIIRPFVNNVPGTDTVVASVFPATGRWSGTISAIFTTAGDLSVRVDGTLRHTIAAASQPYRHFIPVVGGNLFVSEVLSARGIAVTDQTVTS